MLPVCRCESRRASGRSEVVPLIVDRFSRPRRGHFYVVNGGRIRLSLFHTFHNSTSLRVGILLHTSFSRPNNISHCGIESAGKLNDMFPSIALRNRNIVWIGCLTSVLMACACSNRNPLAPTGSSSRMETTAPVAIVSTSAAVPATSADPGPSSTPLAVEPNVVSKEGVEKALLAPKRRPTADKCPNLRGNQKKIPKGYEIKKKRCVKTPTPRLPSPPPPAPAEFIGVCGPNMPGWATVPPGYELDPKTGECVYRSHL